MDVYFDIFSGISGNMVLGALIDLGVELEELNNELKKLGLQDEYNIKVSRTEKEGIGGTYVEVDLLDSVADEEGHSHQEEDNHHQCCKDRDDHECENEHDHEHVHDHKHNHQGHGDKHEHEHHRQ
jgi:hypothetical protein